MNSLMQKPEFAKHILQAPQRWFNAYQGEHNETLQPFQVRRGDLLVHFAGIPAREERMQYWLERAEQHLDDWEVPVKSTSYPHEARDFWNEQKELRRMRKAALEETRVNAAKMLETMDQQMIDYGDRLNDEQKAGITKQRDELKKILEDPKTQEEVSKIHEGMKGLAESLKPLTDVMAEANKLLLQAAHEAIFAGEKDLLDAGFSQGSSTPDLEQISTAVKNLKALIMAPEDSWNRHDIENATNDIVNGRAKWLEKVALELAAQKQALEEQDASATAQEGAQEGLEPPETLEGPELQEDHEAQKPQDAALQASEDAVEATASMNVAEDGTLSSAAEDGSVPTAIESPGDFVIVNGPTQSVTIMTTTTSSEDASPTETVSGD